MRIVILSSNVYSETACALAARLAHQGHVPVGALTLRTLHAGTVVRKLGQWGPGKVANYAAAKLFSRQGNSQSQLQNPYLLPLLEHSGTAFRTLREVATFHEFPIAVCGDQNSPSSVARLKQWSPDLLIYAGGNILRKPLLEIPRLGVLNAHLGLLPEVRGMSSPEWSLLQDIPPGITIHYIDAGIDTGPILQRCELPDAARGQSLADLRDRLTAFGVVKMAEVVAALDRGTISATPQAELERDNQFFVMHEWLQARASGHLAKVHSPSSPAELRG
jgi:methionyl-tRNA formyltransferase